MKTIASLLLTLAVDGRCFSIKDADRMRIRASR
jgi:hypothetical protein